MRAARVRAHARGGRPVRSHLRSVRQTRREAEAENVRQMSNDPDTLAYQDALDLGYENRDILYRWTVYDKNGMIDPYLNPARMRSVARAIYAQRRGGAATDAQVEGILRGAGVFE